MGTLGSCAANAMETIKLEEIKTPGWPHCVFRAVPTVCFILGAPVLSAFSFLGSGIQLPPAVAAGFGFITLIPDSEVRIHLLGDGSSELAY